MTDQSQTTAARPFSEWTTSDEFNPRVLRRAFLRFIQEQNGCNATEDRLGTPCGEKVCGCWVEMMTHYGDAESV